MNNRKSPVAGAALALVCACAAATTQLPEDSPPIFSGADVVLLRSEAQPMDAPAEDALGFIVPATDGAPERRFVTARPNAGEALPAVLLGPSAPGAGWTRLLLNDSAVAGYTWVFAGPVGATRHIFAVLDSGLDELAPELVTVTSVAAGFAIRGRLHKPDPRARLERVAMDVNGHGRISLRLDWRHDLEAVVGTYHYDTTDGGRTFAPVVHEP